MRLNIELNPPTGRTTACFAVRAALLIAGATLTIGGIDIGHNVLAAIGALGFALGLALVVAARCGVQASVLRDAESRGYDRGYQDGREAEREILTELSAAVDGAMVPLNSSPEKLPE